MNDYFGILGLKSSADVTEIKKAYRQKALQYHPDKNKNPGAADMFVKVSEAYSYLMDDDRRKSMQNSEQKQAFYQRKQDLYEAWLRNERSRVRYQAKKQAETPYEIFESKIIGELAKATSKFFNFVILFFAFLVLFMPWIGYYTEKNDEKRIPLDYVLILSFFGVILLFGAIKMTFSNEHN